AEKLWQAAQKALVNMGVGAERIERVVGAKDQKALAVLVTELTSGSPPKPEAKSQPSAVPTPPSAAPASSSPAAAPVAKAPAAEPTPEDLKRAYKAFKRRLKVTRL